MFLFIRLFFGFIFLYHILLTLIVYGFLDGSFANLFSFAKDLIWILFVFIVALLNYNLIIPFIKKYKYLLLTFVCLVIWSLFISFANNKSIFDIFIGVKYDLYFLFVVISSIFLGMVIYKRLLTNELYNFFNFIFYSLIVVLVAGLVWHGLKLGFKDLFFKLGYGPIGDYVPGQNPPIYYRTGPGGYSRWSGIFAGPNNYGYLLVLFFSFFLFKIEELFGNTKNNIKIIGLNIIYYISIALTISRGAILGVLVQLFLIFKKYLLKPRYLISILIIAVLGVAGLSYWKGKSTMLHINSSLKSIEYMSNKIMGYGLGSSGPAVHYNGYILPENTYLQISIDTGILGFLFFAIFFGYLFRIIYLIVNSDGSLKFSIYLKLLTFGLIGILFEGLFLHVFEDSMINYLFFISWGILIGYLFNDL